MKLVSYVKKNLTDNGPAVLSAGCEWATKEIKSTILTLGIGIVVFGSIAALVPREWLIAKDVE